MMRRINKVWMSAWVVSAWVAFAASGFGHGTVISPISRVYRVYLSNPENPNFTLAANAVAIDGTDAYYTWNELSRNIPEAVLAGLPPGFDYSPWVPDGQLASAGRVDAQSPDYSRTYAGLDQVSADWPTTTVTAGETLEVDFLATAPHDPSVWDVWMTTPDWDPETVLNWNQMEFLGRPSVTLVAGHYYFDLEIPANRSGHHVLWVAWQRNDPVGEVFFSTTDLLINGAPNSAFIRGDTNQDGTVQLPDVIDNLNHLFSGLPTTCIEAHDANDDHALDVSDPIWSLTYLFLSGSVPPPPFPRCGDDLDPDSLGCVSSAACP